MHIKHVETSFIEMFPFWRVCACICREHSFRCLSLVERCQLLALASTHIAMPIRTSRIPKYVSERRNIMRAHRVSCNYRCPCLMTTIKCHVYCQQFTRVRQMDCMGGIFVNHQRQNTNGSFRVNSTNFCKSSQVTVSNIAQQIPKITLVSIMKACTILGCNSEYFWRYSLSNFLFCIAFLPSRLKC